MNQPLWLGSFEVKLGSRSTIPTTEPYDENYTHKLLNDSLHDRNQTSSLFATSNYVLLLVFLLTLVQILPLTMWYFTKNSCLRCSSQTGQYILTSSALPTTIRRFLLRVLRCFLPSISLSLSLNKGNQIRIENEQEEQAKQIQHVQQIQQLEQMHKEHPRSIHNTSTNATNNAIKTPQKQRIPISNVPKHIAIIMDGNRRYGKEMYGDTGRGHVDGGHTLSRVIDWCLEFGVQVLTVYAFSTENWNRDQAEIDLLMDIFVSQADEILQEAKQRNVNVKILSSDPNKLPTFVQRKFQQLEEETKHGCNMTLNLCVSYGGRGDIVNACRNVASKLMTGEIQTVKDINEEMLSKEMLTGQCVVPDPDLLIRTSGERRLSNFLLWQVAYSEFIFVEKHWPAINRNDMLDILEEYERRKRRFGK